MAQVDQAPLMPVANLQHGHDPPHPPSQSISLSFFIAKHFTVFEAGFALKTHGSLVKGLMPLRAAVAGLFLSFMFSMPASLKAPDFFAALRAFMAFFMAFMAFAFIAFIAAMLRG